MAFQKTVNTYPGIGIPGAYAAINPIVSTAKGYVASAACNIGGFVWAANKEGCVKPTGALAALWALQCAKSPTRWELM